MPSFLVWAQWLSDHSLAATLAMALLAFATEGLSQVRAKARTSIAQTGQQPSSGVINPWASTWLTNASLLACAMAVSWSLGPWLSPWFSDALSGKTGLLVWLGFDNGVSIAHTVIGLFLLDLVAYVLHRVMHVVPIFWRAHQVHHSDTAMNASTHFRQHPLQLIATTAMQLPLLWLLGIPGISWVLYTMLALVVELWHHSAMRLPSTLERWLSWCIVTPNFHRTHHHQERTFHDANYGAVFPIWDRLFGTATSSPLNALIGLRRWTSNDAGETIALNACLVMPFQALTQPGTIVTPKATLPEAKKLRVRQKLHTNHRGKT